MRALHGAVAAAALALAGGALALPGGQSTTYLGGGKGRVTFDARSHAKAGLLCRDCHADRFPTRRTGLISRADHERGAACFGCHDGKRAFSACDGCHRR